MTGRRKRLWWVVCLITVGICLPMLAYLYSEWRDAVEWRNRKRCRANQAAIAEALADHRKRIEEENYGRRYTVQRVMISSLEYTNWWVCPSARGDERTPDQCYVRVWRGVRCDIDPDYHSGNYRRNRPTAWQRFIDWLL